MNTRKWLSRFAVIAVALTGTLAMVAQDADAKRFGGGKSSGRQSTNVSKQYNQPPASTPTQQAAPSQPQAAPGAAAQPQRNRWLGPIAGIAAGLGLAALMSHLGMGGAFAEMLGSMLLIGLLVFAGLFIWRMLQRNRTGALPPPPQPAYDFPGAGGRANENANERATENATRYEAPPTSAPLPGGAANSVMASFNDASSWGIPDDFDKEGFERSAKVHFIRLQAAWDAKDVADIREFTTPEMYAEIKMQMRELGDEKSVTEVVDIEAKVLGVERGAREDLASVAFKGTVRETVNGPAEPFEEVWNLIKPTDGKAGWLLAGIQQVK